MHGRSLIPDISFYPGFPEKVSKPDIAFTYFGYLTGKIQDTKTVFQKQMFKLFGLP